MSGEAERTAGVHETAVFLRIRNIASRRAGVLRYRHALPYYGSDAAGADCHFAHRGICRKLLRTWSALDPRGPSLAASRHRYHRAV